LECSRPVKKGGQDEAIRAMIWQVIIFPDTTFAPSLDPSQSVLWKALLPKLKEELGPPGDNIEFDEPIMSGNRPPETPPTPAVDKRKASVELTNSPRHPSLETTP
jgi:hypothetical protein